jgi:hypothetical protein
MKFGYRPVLAGAALAALTLGLMQLQVQERRLLLPHAALPYAGSKAAPADDAQPGTGRWAIVYHGTCCEGNLAAAGDNTYVLLPELTAGNDILRSSDNGLTWSKRYPAVDLSAPFGIEGDLQAWENDVIYFGTELAIAPVAFSSDGGETFTLTQAPVIPAVNDQAWAYLGPVDAHCPAPFTQSKPYVLAGWFRIGAEIVFSCDGGLTWPLHAPLVGNGAGTGHVACRGTAAAAKDGGDARLPHENFRNMKAGRHGTWGTDGQFYWADISGDEIYVCRSADFGQTWSGHYHPVADGIASTFSVLHAVFDHQGTLYVMHGDRIYVSFDQGASFRYVHPMPRYGNAARSDPGASQYMAVYDGVVEVSLIEIYGEDGTEGRIWYLRGHDLDTDQPRWHAEPVDIMGNVRLDFMQIALNGHGVPTISYTTPDAGTEPREVTTASLQTRLPYVSLQASRLTGAAPLEVIFDAASSSDLEAEPLRHDFDFGDGTVVAGGEAIQTHAYGAPGSYRARVTVTNPQGQSNVAEVEIAVRGEKAAAARFGGAVAPLFLVLMLLLPTRRYFERKDGARSLR